MFLSYEIAQTLDQIEHTFYTESCGQDLPSEPRTCGITRRIVSAKLSAFGGARMRRQPSCARCGTCPARTAAVASHRIRWISTIGTPKRNPSTSALVGRPSRIGSRSWPRRRSATSSARTATGFVREPATGGGSHRALPQRHRGLDITAIDGVTQLIFSISFAQFHVPTATTDSPSARWTSIIAIQ